MKQQQRSLAALLLLLTWDRSAQGKFCHAIVGEGMQAPCHHAFTFTFTFSFTYGCIRGAWRGGCHSTAEQGLGSCMQNSRKEGAETWFSLSRAMERVWGNWYSEVHLGFDLFPQRFSWAPYPFPVCCVYLRQQDKQFPGREVTTISLLWS